MRRRLDAPRAGPRRIRLERDHIRSRSKGVWWTRHRLDRDAAPPHVRKRGAGEDHEVAIAVVEPEREAIAARRFPEPDARTPVVAWSKIGEGGVELRPADRSRPAEVVVRSVDGRRANGDAALVRAENRPRRH